MEVSGSQGVQIGTGNVQHVYFGADAPPRSSYIDLVRHIAPKPLKERDAELAEMAAFCLEPDRGPYLWWRARAWSGKTALLSWFVLHPPPGVRVVSFFITNRLGSQADQAAYTEAVLEQLADLLNQPLPANLATATRPALLMRLFAEAALLCRRRGESLVLVVDGLDEDQGNRNHGEGTVAALLPAHIDGLRVIVASRTNPPIETLVPSGHPLRSAQAMQNLAPSPRAGDIKTAAEKELERLLAGGEPGTRILGLITAAGGGLNPDNLAELADAKRLDVTNWLRDAGRTLERRPSTLYRGIRPDSYVLGHEELLKTAADELSDQLAGERQRLYDWYDRYRHEGWPEHTPEYLLRGYFQMTRAAGDDARMIACTTDPARHDRMERASGGDTAALTEISLAQTVLINRAVPDLLALVRLAIARERLNGRNIGTPTKLPVAWAKAGQLSRAEALAYSITDPEDRSQALAELAKQAETAGDHTRAARTAAEAVRLVARLPTGRLVDLVTQAEERNLPEYAEALVHAIGNPRDRVEAMVELVELAAEREDFERHRALTHQAAALAGDIPNVWSRDEALAEVVQAAGLGADDELALHIADRIADLETRTSALALIAETHHDNGQPARALAIATKLSAGYQQTRVLTDLAEEMAEDGHHDDALRTALLIKELDGQGTAIAALAKRAIRRGDADRATGLVSAIIDPERQDHVVEELVSSVLQRRNHVLAHALTMAITDAERRDTALARLVGEFEEHDLTAEALPIARSIRAPAAQAIALRYLINAALRAGQTESAIELAEGIRDGRNRSDQLTALAVRAAERGDYAEGCRIAGKIDAADDRMAALSQLAKVAAKAGHHDRSATLIDAVSGEATRATVLLELVRAEIERHDHDQALAYAVLVPDEFVRAEALTLVVDALVRAGDIDRAVALAVDLPPGLAKANTLAAAAAAAGSGTLGATLAQAAAEMSRFTGEPYSDVTALADMALAVADQGDRDRTLALIARAKSAADLSVDVAERVRVIEHLSRAARVADQPDLASTLLAESEAVALAATRPEERLHALTHLAVAAWNAGRHDSAGELVQAIDRDRRDPALARLAEVAAESRDLRRGTGFAQSIVDQDIRADALSVLAEAAAAAEDSELMVRLLRSVTAKRRDRAVAELAQKIAETREAMAMELVALINNVLMHDETIDLLVERVIRTGDFRRADVLARAMSDEWSRSNTRAKVAKAAIQAAQPDIATEISLGLFGDSQEHFLGEIADFAVANHQVEMARRIAATSSSGYWKSTLLIRLSREAIQAGDPRMAAEIVEQLRSWERAEALTEAAEAAARMGHFAVAISAAEAIDDEDERNALTIKLVQAAVTAGKIDDATTSARSVSDPQEQAEAIMHLIRALMAAGELVQATDIAAQISDPAEQSKAYTFLAMGAAAADDRLGADRLLAKALAVGPWAQCRDALARLRPDVLLAVADDYLAFGGEDRWAEGGAP